MQNVYKRITFKKTPAVILCIFFLFVMIIAASSLKHTYASQIEYPVSANHSMYMQLKPLAKKPLKVIILEPKMNNEKTENANTVKNSTSGTFSVDTVKVLDHTTGTIFNQPLEEYTLCALLAEMPLSFDSQALMAQSVAVRTFVARNIKLGSKHEGADVCTDYRCCQSYKNISKISSDISKAKEAVEATKGIIAVFNNDPIIAAYHSSSVGHTKSSKSVWGGDVPYLVPVVAAESKDATGKKTVISEFLTVKLLQLELL